MCCCSKRRRQRQRRAVFLLPLPSPPVVKIEYERSDEIPKKMLIPVPRWRSSARRVDAVTRQPLRRPHHRRNAVNDFCYFLIDNDVFILRWRRCWCRWRFQFWWRRRRQRNKTLPLATVYLVIMKAKYNANDPNPPLREESKYCVIKYFYKF